MSAFGDIARGGPYGDVVDTCYHIFIVFILVNATPDGGWEVSDDFDLVAFGQGMSGNIHKSCRCMSKFDMLKLTTALRAAGVGGGISTSTATGGGTIYSGYEVENKGKCPPLKCRCSENIELGDVSNTDGYWTDSTGALHPFNTTKSADVMRDIINTESLLPCAC